MYPTVDDADHPTAPTRQREYNHTDHTDHTDRTDQGSIHVYALKYLDKRVTIHDLQMICPKDLNDASANR